MILPPDDSLILDDSDDGGLALNKHNQPMASLADVLGLLPAWAQKGTSAVRNAWLLTWGAMTNTAWSRACFALDLGESPRFAQGYWLDSIWGVYLKKIRLAGETDADYRFRLMTPFDVVTPSAIKAAVDAIVARVSPVPAVYQETSADFIALSPLSGAPWESFLQPPNKRLLAHYPDKGDDVPTYIVPLDIAQFWIVLPADSNDDSQAAHCLNPSSSDYDLTADFVMPSSSSTFGFLAPVPDTTMEEIRSDVEQRKAGGVTWLMFVDPLLESAV